MSATFLAEGKDMQELLPARGSTVIFGPKSRARLVARLSDLDYTWSSPERPVNGWPAGHAAALLRRLVLWSLVLAGGGSSPSSARSSVSW